MAKAYTGPERRRFKRIKKEFVIKLRVYPKGKVILKGEHDEVSVQNIGGGGVFLSYGKEIEIGRFVDLNIKFSGLHEPIRCLGKVVRIEPSNQSKTPGQPPLYHIAVRFVQTTDRRAEEIINKVIEQYHSAEMHKKG